MPRKPKLQTQQVDDPKKLRAKSRAAARSPRKAIKQARRQGELFAGDAQRNLFVGTEYLDPARDRSKEL